MGESVMIKKAAMGFMVVLLLTGCATATLSGYGQGGQQADGRSYEEARNDNLITSEVNRLLVKNRAVDAMDITASTRNGVVTLDGSVPSQTMARRAAELVSGVPGVSSVNNKLTVKK